MREKIGSTMRKLYASARRIASLGKLMDIKLKNKKGRGEKES